MPSMNNIDRLKLSSAILSKARELGADAAGIADFNEVKECPSLSADFKIPQIEAGRREGSFETEEKLLPEDGKSVIVIAISHPEDKPELDWRYENYATQGNQRLIEINKNLIKWLKSNYKQIKTYHIPYFIEKGGIYLKDTAVMAGLGTIGRNNLLITPEYGPRVRLRAVVVNVELVSTGPLAFDPCAGCEGYCLRECPQGAFDEIIYSQAVMGQEFLPGRTGTYSRLKCNDQMERDKQAGKQKDERVLHKPTDEMVCLFKHCRNCEFSCPVGL